MDFSQSINTKRWIFGLDQHKQRFFHTKAASQASGVGIRKLGLGFNFFIILGNICKAELQK